MKKLRLIALYGLLCGAVFSCSPAEKQAGIASLEELKTARFGVVSGTVADQIVLKRFPEASFGYYNSPLDACLAVLKGKELAVAYDEPILRNIRAQNPGLKILPDMISVDHYGMAVRKDNPELKKAADALIAELKADGRYDRMMNRWFPIKGKPAPMPEMAWEAKNGVLDFGTSAITEPFSFFDDSRRIVGFDIEIVSLLAQRLGRELRIHNMDFGAMIPSLLSGKTDIIAACITVTEERAKSVLFTEPYYTGGIAAAVTLKKYLAAGRGPETKIDVGLRTLDDLKHKRIGVLLGSAQDKFVTAHFPESEVIRIDGTTNLDMSLLQGQCEAVLLDNVQAALLMKKNDRIAFLDDAVTCDRFAIAFPLNNTRRRDRFNDFLKKIRADGTYDGMAARWIDKVATAQMPEIENPGGNGTLRIGTTGESQPFSFLKDDRIVGFDVELMLRFAADLGMKPAISTYNFSGLLAALISGKVDVIGNNIMVTEERARQMAFSDPYFETASGMVVLKKNLAAGAGPPPKAGGGVDVATAVIGAMTGTTGEMIVRERFPRADLRLFDDVMDAVAAMKARKLDYVITAYTTALRAAGANKELAVLPEEYNHEWASIAVPKSNQELLERIDAILNAFRADGTLDEIIGHWVRPDGSPYEIVKVPKAAGGAPLRVAIAANREPMGFVQGNEIVGLDPELIERVAYRLGRPVVYSDMKFSALIAALESGKADVICSNLTATEERKLRVNFSRGYYVNPQVMLAVRDRTAAARGTAGPAAGSHWLDRVKTSFYNNIILEKRYILIWKGLKVTFLIAVLSALLGTLLGALICLMRMSKNKMLKTFAKIYIDLLRGIPQVVLLMLMFYVVFAPLDVSGVAVAIFTFAMNFAAYVSEMFRTGIESVKRGQVEAGVAMGFSKFRTFAHIVLPQAVQRILPVYKGEFIALVKMTAIVGYIAVQDLTKASDIIRSRTFDAFFPLIMVAVLYFVLAWLLTSLLEMIQVRTGPKRRRT